MRDRQRRRTSSRAARSEPALTAQERAELERYVVEFADDWDAREQRFRTTFGLMVEAGQMSAEERHQRLSEIHETRLEHEREHRATMLDAIRMTDEEWEAIQADPEFRENMRHLQELATALAEGVSKLELTADPDDPVANLIARNLAGSVERTARAIDGAAHAANERGGSHEED